MRAAAINRTCKSGRIDPASRHCAEKFSATISASGRERDAFSKNTNWRCAELRPLYQDLDPTMPPAFLPPCDINIAYLLPSDFSGRPQAGRGWTWRVGEFRLSG